MPQANLSLLSAPFAAVHFLAWPFPLELPAPPAQTCPRSPVSRVPVPLVRSLLGQLPAAFGAGGFAGASSSGNAPGSFVVPRLAHDELVEVSVTLAAEFLSARRVVLREGPLRSKPLLILPTSSPRGHPARGGTPPRREGTASAGCHSTHTSGQGPPLPEGEMGEGAGEKYGVSTQMLGLAGGEGSAQTWCCDVSEGLNRVWSVEAWEDEAQETTRGKPRCSRWVRKSPRRQGVTAASTEPGRLTGSRALRRRPARCTVVQESLGVSCGATRTC